MSSSHYYSRSQGTVVERPPQNPCVEAGRNAGRKQRNKDKKLGTYPRPGLPISRRNRDPDWVEGYRRGYYQDLRVGRPALLESKRVTISVTVNRDLLGAADGQGISRSKAIDKGLQALLSQNSNHTDFARE